jgi:hypothetical protein
MSEQHPKEPISSVDAFDVFGSASLRAGRGKVG